MEPLEPTPEPAPEPASRTHRVRTSDGVTVAVHEWDGAGRPVVLHHGFSASASLEWPRSGVPRALRAAGRRVLAPDARGHGESEAPHDPARYGEARMAADVVEVLDALGVDDVDLVGYSMGAVVSALVASTRPARVHRLVLAGVGAGVVELGGVDTRVLPAAALAAALRARDPGDLDPVVRGFREFAEGTGNDLLALAAQADAVHDRPLDLAAVTAPTLVLAGDADPLARRPEVLAAAVPGARSQLVRGDHGAALTDPGFAAAVAAFLR
ncbi:pimeloyl-ACP methyl ester carboxylesterase [Kineococcus radiotolerans]|uniref:Pimeloyl-ACP methyl ester carboxylesterase n=1 Tax=Kineococcus radiotolerans TaxID=131568 RepID=A0A7W4TPE4_KINRA|nr:alpha/beta fold hydrolase [Kineococcus radiotolerans]MBB2902485.1 pimeloyl-ACP methyl ester carboxylesterase [Kineococcus radiotolerans]